MQASRDYEIKDTVLSRWKQEFLERAPQLFAEAPKEDTSRERIAELEQMVGRLTMQLEMAKKVLGYSSSAGKESKCAGAERKAGYPVEMAWKCWDWHTAVITTAARKQRKRSWKRRCKG